MHHLTANVVRVKVFKQEEKLEVSWPEKSSVAVEVT